MKIRIGLIGEDPNDTKSIQNLLAQYPVPFNFEILSQNYYGHDLDSVKAEKHFKSVCAKGKIDIVIVIRDLDAICTYEERIKAKRKWFEKFRSLKGAEKTIFLLNIYELEALILTDLSYFNKKFRTSIQYSKNVMFEHEPKEFLKRKTQNRFHEDDCPELFKHLNIETVKSNCKYFKEFIAELDKAVEKATA